jgi:hypothetical protein
VVDAALEHIAEIPEATRIDPEYVALSGAMLSPPLPRNMGDDVWRAVSALNKKSDLDVPRTLESLLSSSNAFLRIVGAVWLVERNRGVDRPVLERLATDEDINVPLTVLAWLRDSVLSPYSQQLSALMRERANGMDNVVEALRENKLNELAARAGLWMADAHLPKEDKVSLFTDVARELAAPYQSRLQALMQLRSVMDFEDYQQIVSECATSDPVTNARPGAVVLTDDSDVFEVAAGLLNERVAGPSQVMGAVPVMTRRDVDLFFATESSVMLNNVAMWIETAEEKPDQVHLQRGFADAIYTAIADLPREELPPEQLLALRRIELRLPALRSLERNDVQSPLE